MNLTLLESAAIGLVAGLLLASGYWYCFVISLINGREDFCERMAKDLEASDDRWRLLVKELETKLRQAREDKP